MNHPYPKKNQMMIQNQPNNNSYKNSMKRRSIWKEKKMFESEVNTINRESENDL
jgi:hypothetical protein